MKKMTTPYTYFRKAIAVAAVVGLAFPAVSHADWRDSHKKSESKHEYKKPKWKHHKKEKEELVLEKCTEGFDRLKCAGAETNTLVGAAVRWDFYNTDPDYVATFAENFNYMTPENDTKWGLMSDRPFRFDYSRADELVDWANDNDIKVKAHALLWHIELPSYFTEELSPARARVMAMHHIIRTAHHFKGRVYAWDVVNEAFEDDGSPRDSILLRKLGPNYVSNAFRLAHSMDRNAKLFYNDYSIATINQKSNAVYDMVKNMVETGVPIHGVGFQMHIEANSAPSAEQLRENFQRFIDLGVTVNISELDVRTANVIGSPERKNRVQKAVYQRIAYVCQEMPGCDGMSTWGFTDKYTWIDDFYGADDPLQFDENYEKKPAYFGQLDGLYGIEPVDPNYGDNIVPNAGFESGTDWWFSFGATMTTTTDPVRSGLASALVTDRNGSYQAAAISLTSFVSPGASYQATAWARVAGAANDSVLLTGKIVCNGQPDQYIGISSALASDTDWTKLQGVISIPQCQLNEFLLYVEGPATGVDLLVDDVELRKEEQDFGDNVLINSGFEDGIAPWFGLAGTLSASTEQAFNGAYSAKLTDRFANWNGIAIDAKPLTTGGAGYEVSVQTRVAGSASENIIVTAKTVCEGEAENYSPIGVATATDSGWTKVSGTFSVPTCNLTEFLLYVEGPAAAVDLYVDDFEMRAALSD